MLDATDKRLLEEVADLHGLPMGAYNIRKNGQGIRRKTTANIEIATKEDKPGINVVIKPGTKGESVHIPVILSREDLHDLVGDGTVMIEPRHHEDEMGTLAQRRDRGHGRVDTVLACFIAGGRHHASLLAIAHSDGLTAIVGVVALFDGGIEGIHIHMDYLAVHRGKYNGNLLHIKAKECFIYAFNIRSQTISALITAMGSPAPGVVEAPT